MYCLSLYFSEYTIALFAEEEKYILLYWVFVAALGLSPVAASRSHSVVMHGLLIVVASLVVEHEF